MLTNDLVDLRVSLLTNNNTEALIMFNLSTNPSFKGFDPYLVHQNQAVLLLKY